MATRRFTLTETQRSELRLAYDHCKDGPTRTRLQAVRLYGSAYPFAQVQEITGCSRTSLMDWCRRHREAELAVLGKRFEAHLSSTTFVTTFLEHRGFYTVCPRSN